MGIKRARARANPHGYWRFAGALDAVSECPERMSGAKFNTPFFCAVIVASAVLLSAIKTVGGISMDFSSQALRPGEVVIWSGALEKARHDAATKPAPPLAEESRPRMRQCEKSVDVSTVFNVSDERVIRSLRTKWGIEP